MKNILLMTIAVVCLFSGPVYAAQTAIDFSSAKRGSTYATKKAECQRAVKGKKFGIHLVERNRWIDDCIAGRRT